MDPALIGTAITALATVSAAFVMKSAKAKAFLDQANLSNNRNIQVGHSNVGAGANSIHGSHNNLSVGRPMEKDIAFSPEAFAEFQRREAQLRQHERALAEAQEAQLRSAHMSVRRTRVWTALAALSALGLGIVLGGLMRPPEPTAAQAESPVVNSATGTPASAGSANPTTAADVARKYFAFAGQRDVAGMRSVATDDYLDDSGGAHQFESYWGSIVSVEAEISPGREPLLDPSHPEAVWVQVAWRASKEGPVGLSGTSWHLTWFKIRSAATGYLIAVKRDGAPKTCATANLPTCSAQDTFAP